MHSKPAPTTWSRPNAATPTTGYLGAGYAIPTDPVYSAKALHAVADLARDGRGPLIFWHTGGIPALFSDEAGISAWP
jgi:1-aminocyclopropane-1-carboxylate deaminase/D-cysteine desulfhydrase-like pyridoxal-dependent ACC family enzyme